jgi:hypothetical protein
MMVRDQGLEGMIIGDAVIYLIQGHDKNGKGRSRAL